MLNVGDTVYLRSDKKTPMTIAEKSRTGFNCHWRDKEGNMQWSVFGEEELTKRRFWFQFWKK